MKAETHKLLFEALQKMNEAARDLVAQSEYDDAKKAIEMAATLDSFVLDQEVEEDGLNTLEREMVEANDKIGAIKNLRNRVNGMTLHGAKDIVDAYVTKKSTEIPF